MNLNFDKEETKTNTLLPIQPLLRTFLKPCHGMLSPPKEEPFQHYTLKGIGLAPFSTRIIHKDELVATLTGEMILTHEINPSQDLVYQLGKVRSDVIIALKPFKGSKFCYFRVTKESNLYVAPYLNHDNETCNLGIFAKDKIKPFSLLTLDHVHAIISENQVLNELPTIQIETPVTMFDADPEKRFIQNHSKILPKNEKLIGLLDRHFKELCNMPSSLKDQIAQLQKFDLMDGLPHGLCYGRLPFGVGIFVSPKASPIPKGAIIGLYTGEIKFYPEREEFEEDFIRHAYAFLIVGSEQVTDEEVSILRASGLLEEQCSSSDKITIEVNSLEQGNYTRYINHSSRSPNLKYEMYIYENEVFICFVTTEDIHPGSQLLFDYGSSYWKNRSFEPLPLNPTSFYMTL